METALAARFGNVSNADSPLNLAKAEVDFELAMDDSHLSANQPYSAEVDQAIHELAAACGIQGTAAGIGP